MIQSVDNTAINFPSFPFSYQGLAFLRILLLEGTSVITASVFIHPAFIEIVKRTSLFQRRAATCAVCQSLKLLLKVRNC